MIDALSFPNGKRAQAVFPLETENFFYPNGSSKDYTVIEITMMEGREVSARKTLANLLFTRIESELGIRPADNEIYIAQAPAHNWGIKGVTGDQLKLDKSLRHSEIGFLGIHAAFYKANRAKNLHLGMHSL